MARSGSGGRSRGLLWRPFALLAKEAASLAACVVQTWTSFWPPWRSRRRVLFWLLVLSLNLLLWCIFTPPFSRLGEGGYDGGAWPALRRSVFNNKSIVYVLVGLMVLARMPHSLRGSSR